VRQVDFWFRPSGNLNQNAAEARLLSNAGFFGIFISCPSCVKVDVPFDHQPARGMPA
jgi:hypothetical protein